jgi:MATE family, multidrug efflux pump
MSEIVEKYDPVKGNVRAVFWHYSLPEIAGLLAMSSASLVDSIFLGNYVGSSALATVNLSVPALTLFWAIAMLIAVGGSVVCGKYLGQKKKELANQVFTTTMIVGLACAGLMLVLGVTFIDQIISGLGANEPEIAGMVNVYLGIILWCTPFFVFELIAFYFVRLAGNPILASGAFIIGSAVNVMLDYIFIVKFNWGLMGAAYATGFSAALVCVILLPYFLKKKSRLKFSKPMTDIAVLIKAYINGLSEFANEISIGVTALIFNWVMISRLGMDGVAALTIINNIWLMGLFTSIGMCDALQPIISQNFGARNPERITEFLKMASYAVLAVAVIMITAMLIYPDLLISIFLESGAINTREIAAEFMFYLWPAFLFIGLNILLTVYFTSMQKPLESTYIAFLRSFILPATALLLLPLWIGDVGMYIALPLAEALTFIVAVLLYSKAKPDYIISNDPQHD